MLSVPVDLFTLIRCKAISVSGWGINYIVGWYFTINSKSGMVIGQPRQIAADRDYKLI